MTTFHAWGEGRVVSFTKGAIEAIVENSVAIRGAGGVTDIDAHGILAAAERVSADGLRTLGFAMREWPRTTRRSSHRERWRGALSFSGSPA